MRYDFKKNARRDETRHASPLASSPRPRPPRAPSRHPGAAVCRFIIPPPFFCPPKVVCEKTASVVSLAPPPSLSSHQLIHTTRASRRSIFLHPNHSKEAHHLHFTRPTRSVPAWGAGGRRRTPHPRSRRRRRDRPARAWLRARRRRAARRRTPGTSATPRRT